MMDLVFIGTVQSGVYIWTSRILGPSISWIAMCPCPLIYLIHLIFFFCISFLFLLFLFCLDLSLSLLHPRSLDYHL